MRALGRPVLSLCLFTALAVCQACGGSSPPPAQPPDGGGPGQPDGGPGDFDAGPKPPTGALAVTRQRTEYRVDPIGLDVAAPRLEWRLESSVRDQRQTAYRVLVASSRAHLDADEGDLWDSGKVVSEQTTVDLPWIAERLRMRSRTNASQQIRRHRLRPPTLPKALQRWVS